MLKKALSLIISILIAFSVFSFNISATEQGKGEFIVAVDTVQANAGDSVIVKLRVKNNPGIMAMTISITYDSSVLEFQRYYYGKVFEDYTLKEHPTRNIIRLVISEEQDTYGDGAIVGIQFKVAADAEAKLHGMTVEYSSGDFCNYDLERLMPKIESGGVEVAYNGHNCGHRKYGEWTENMAPTCTENGAEQRICEKCGHTEIRDKAATGHDYSDKWVVDIPATKDKAGTMSRHCKNCTATTDETTFTLEQSDEGKIDNKEDAVVPDNDVIKDIIIEQHPDINPSDPNGDKETASDTESKPSKPQNPTSQVSDTQISSKEESSDITSSSTESTSSSENNTNKTEEEASSEYSDNPNFKEVNKQVKDILDILYPDKANDETAIKIAEKLYDVFPQFDTILTVVKTSIISVLAFIFI